MKSCDAVAVLATGVVLSVTVNDAVNVPTAAGVTDGAAAVEEVGDGLAVPLNVHA